MVQQPNTSVGALPFDPKSGYCPDTKIYQSLRPVVPIPTDSEPLSVYDYALSLLRQSPADDIPFVVSSSTGHSLPYSDFLLLVDSLAYSLSSLHSLTHEDVAFVICPPSLHVPLVYFALLRLRVVISPSNPLSTRHEVSHQLSLSRPTIAFATSSTSHLLTPSSTFSRGIFLLDSPTFLSLLSSPPPLLTRRPPLPPLPQSLPAAILFSSGTTGRVKGVILTHRNLIALLSGLYHQKADLSADEEQDIPSPVSLFILPLFHVFGFFSMIKVFAFRETMVLMDERFELEALLRAVSRYRVTSMPVSPPLIVALAKSDLTRKYVMSSLRTVACGGAPLGKEVAERFKEKFPHIEIVQGYGMTETTGAATRTLGPDESSRHGSAGRLAENLEAKIVDPETGECLPPGQSGELWLRGPIVMTGYVGDDKATAETLTSEGWLKTGDLCYFDPEGFLYIVDRLKELIKYKAYQVPPAELERLLQSNPEIADAAVIPYPDEESGEIPMALVVRRPGSSISESQVIDFIAKRVAPYKKVRRVAFIDSIPKSPAGKIIRRDLIKLAISHTSSRL